MVLAMTACGTDPKSVDYFGMSYSDIQDNMEQTVSALVSFSDEDIQSGAEYYDSNGMDAFAHLLTSWGETVSDLGSYQGLGDLTVTKARLDRQGDRHLHGRGHQALHRRAHGALRRGKAPVPVRSGRIRQAEAG